MWVPQNDVMAFPSNRFLPTKTNLIYVHSKLNYFQDLASLCLWMLFSDYLPQFKIQFNENDVKQQDLNETDPTCKFCATNVMVLNDIIYQKVLFHFQRQLKPDKNSYNW